jgi:hypothetical protein
MTTNLRNPSYWTKVATIAALAGLACGAAGLLFWSDWLLFVGALLSTPLVLGAIASILLLPYAVWLRFKESAADAAPPDSEAHARAKREEPTPEKSNL